MLAGIRFGVLVNPEPIDASKPSGASNAVPPGWVGLGWSAFDPQDAPPQMINGTAVMGWLDSTGQQRVLPLGQLKLSGLQCWGRRCRNSRAG